MKGLQWTAFLQHIVLRLSFSLGGLGTFVLLHSDAIVTIIFITVNITTFLLRSITYTTFIMHQSQ